jgi:hypothetical protein
LLETALIVSFLNTSLIVEIWLINVWRSYFLVFVYTKSMLQKLVEGSWVYESRVYRSTPFTLLSCSYFRWNRHNRWFFEVELALVNLRVPGERERGSFNIRIYNVLEPAFSNKCLGHDLMMISSSFGIFQCFTSWSSAILDFILYCGILSAWSLNSNIVEFSLVRILLNILISVFILIRNIRRISKWS